MTVAFFFLLFLLVGTAVPAFKTLLEGNLYLALCRGSVCGVALPKGEGCASMH